MQRDSSSQDFYSRTVAALDKKEASDAETSRKLQEIKDAATNKGQVTAPSLQKPLADSVAPAESHVSVEVPYKSIATDEASGSSNMEKKVVMKPVAEMETEKERSVAGRKTMRGGELKDVHSGKEAPVSVEKQRVGDVKIDEKKEEKSTEEQEVDLEINSILKKGPSKSNCPI